MSMCGRCVDFRMLYKAGHATCRVYARNRFHRCGHANAPKTRLAQRWNHLCVSSDEFSARLRFRGMREKNNTNMVRASTITRPHQLVPSRFCNVSGVRKGARSLETCMYVSFPSAWPSKLRCMCIDGKKLNMRILTMCELFHWRSQ